MNSGRKTIIALSDSTGETAEQAVHAALAQFGPSDAARVWLRSNVLDEKRVREVLAEAQETGALIVYTLARPELRRRVRALSDQYGVVSLDLLGGLIRAFAWHLDRKPLSLPGLGRETDEAYYERIEAIEFAVNNDDGRRPANLKNAEMVFLGVSRASKTPLSHYIAQRGYKVANVPLVKDVPLPLQVNDLDPRRVFGLTIDPGVLMGIREARMATLGARKEGYADLAHVRQEIIWARRIFSEHPDWTVIDITNKAIEETAATVLQIYRERFGPRNGDEDDAAGGGD